MHSYREILSIRNDLYKILNIVENDRELKNLFGEQDLRGFRTQIRHYDKVLNTIGENGINRDLELEQGFDITKKLINSIKMEIRNKHGIIL